MVGSGDQTSRLCPETTQAGRVPHRHPRGPLLGSRGDRSRKPVARSRPRLPGAVHGHPRRDDRERRAADDPDGSRHDGHEPAVDRQRLHADLRRLPAPRRSRGRPRRAQEGLPHRPRAVHLRLTALCSRDGIDVADHESRPAGPRRRARLTGSALDRDGDLQGRGGPDEGARRLVGDRGRRRRRRPAARRHPRRDPLVALDLPRQHPGRHRRVRALAEATCPSRATSTPTRPSTSPARWRSRPA